MGPEVVCWNGWTEWLDCFLDVRFGLVFGNIFFMLLGVSEGVLLNVEIYGSGGS